MSGAAVRLYRSRSADHDHDHGYMVPDMVPDILPGRDYDAWELDCGELG